MKIQIERLQPFDFISFTGISTIGHKVNNTKTIIMNKGSKTQKINDGKKKIKELQKQFPDEKFRIIEYYNDEKDEDRKPCMILYEV